MGNRASPECFAKPFDFIASKEIHHEKYEKCLSIKIVFHIPPQGKLIWDSGQELVLLVVSLGQQTPEEYLVRPVVKYSCIKDQLCSLQLLQGS